MKSSRSAVFSFLLLLAAGCGRSTGHIPAVRDFDLSGYLGRWHEIARLPHRFERGLERVTAEYRAAPDGSVTVVNQGFRDGEARSVTGRAKLKSPGDPARPGELRVSFFGPFYADYRIIELAPDGRYAVVTGSTMDCLWILARRPRLDPAELAEITARLRGLGFAVDDFEYPAPAE